MHSGSAIAILRNNRNLLRSRKRDKFVHIPGKHRKVKKEKYNQLILNPKLLNGIKMRLVRENKKLYYKRLVIFSVVMISLMIWFISKF